MRVAVHVPPRGPISVRRIGDGAQFILPEVWLEDVSFRTPDVVEGTLMRTLEARVRDKNGWERIRMDLVTGGCFHGPKGECVDKAAFAWVSNDEIQAMGARQSDREAAVHTLPWVTPERRQWHGNLGGLNFDRAPSQDVKSMIDDVLHRHPDVVIVDGSDDWYAPDYVRPVVLVRQTQVHPRAWWHTGTSGQSPSGAIFDKRAYRRFRKAYRKLYGCFPEEVGDAEAGRVGCRCWKGDGLKIYRAA